MLIRSLFSADITRDIPPVVYFHEQSAERLADEVSEYIITGGWPEGDPRRARVPSGIHEQAVRLLTGISAALDRKGGPELPACWISGFYGSGKSSFAKLLGLALDGAVLPSGQPLAEAWLARDQSPRAGELHGAWAALRGQIEPIAVVFDIGAVARDDEHIHGALLRQVQRRLGYSVEPGVADYELRLEKAGHWPRFEALAADLLGRPWSEVRADPLVEDHFSRVLSALMPETFPDPMSWVDARAGTSTASTSAQEAVLALAEMLARRAPGRTLFIVVDEVSQYVGAFPDRMLALQSLVVELGSRLRGRAWLLVTGQQKLEDQADNAVLGKLKDRFPPRLRVHLDNQNIRDVVHRRLLQKTPEAHEQLRALYARHRPSLTLYAYECAGISADDFADVYPLLPGQIDLLLRITSELRARSNRAQGDDHTIRGLLQLLGELFRERGLADRELGALVTLDEVYEVQHTALDADLQNTMSRVLLHCAEHDQPLAARAAKAVALLQLLSEAMPTTAELVAQCLYDRVDRGAAADEVRAALDGLRALSLVIFTERHGYAIQSTAGEEWEHERSTHHPGHEERAPLLIQALSDALGDRKENPSYQGRGFPVVATLSDGRRLSEHPLTTSNDRAVVQVDVRLLPTAEAASSVWLRRSEEDALRDHLIWVTSDVGPVEDAARELARSRRMIERYQPRQASLSLARAQLLVAEGGRRSELERRLREVCEAALMAGRAWFRGDELRPRDFGSALRPALNALCAAVLPRIYPNLVNTNLLPSELAQLLAPGDLSGVSPKFMPNELGILELDGGRYVASCPGVVPRRILEHVERERGVSGASLLAHFGGPPFGYHASVIRACVLGLLRGGRLRIRTEDDAEIVAVRDAGVRELFERDAPLRKAVIYPAGGGTLSPQVRARMVRLFAELGHPVDRDADAIAEGISRHFPALIEATRALLDRVRRVPGSPERAPELARLLEGLEAVFRRVRHTEPALAELARHLDALNDGLARALRWQHAVTDDVVSRLQAVHRVLGVERAQIREVGEERDEIRASAERIEAALARPAPWDELEALQADADRLRATYQQLRAGLLRWQQDEAERSRARVKALPGFEVLNGDQAHHVLRPLFEAMTDTRADSTTPPLRSLREGFREALRRAEELSVARLDELRADRDRRPVVRLDLDLRNREVGTPEEVEALVGEIRRRLLEQVAKGAKVRIT